MVLRSYQSFNVSWFLASVSCVFGFQGFVVFIGFVDFIIIGFIERVVSWELFVVPWVL